MRDVGYYFKNIHDKLKVRADADMKLYNITLTQSRVLAYLNSQGGEATQKEIEIFLNVSHPTVVGVVSRMEQNGYVTCRFDAADKRNKLVRLTEQAHRADMELDRKMRANEQRMLHSLSEEEIDDLKRMLSIILKNLEG